MNPTACHVWWNNIISDNSAIFKKISEKMMSSCVGMPFWILWLDIIFHKVKCALREKSVTVLTYSSAVKCQSMSGGRWTRIWSEWCIKVGLDYMRLFSLLPFWQLMHSRCLRKVSVLHVCHVNIHIPMNIVCWKNMIDS